MKSTIILNKLPFPKLIPPSVVNLLSKWVEYPEINFILIFGSRALGDAEARSDIDISISAPSISLNKWLQIKKMAEEANTLLWITVVNFEYSPIELRKRNLKEGVIVYERKKT